MRANIGASKCVDMVSRIPTLVTRWPFSHKEPDELSSKWKPPVTPYYASMHQPNVINSLISLFKDQFASGR